MFRQRWPDEAMGICKADPAVVNYCNEAQEQLLMDPMAPDEGWWGSWVTLSLTAFVTNGAAYVTTPNEIARLIVLAACQQPLRIRNGFYEYLKFGTGLQPKNCRTSNCGAEFQAIQRDNVVTLADLLTTPQKIRVYPSDSRDTGLRVLIQGTDQNGMTVLTTDPSTGKSAPGEYLQLAFPFVDTANQYSKITGIQKDQTFGPLQFFQVDPVSGAEVSLSTMNPNEGQASYRRYLINGIPNTNLCCTSPANPITITAQGRIDFAPVENETDYLSLPCIPALIEESQSIRFSRMDSGNASQQSILHHVKALNFLNGQLDLYLGKVNTAVKVPLFGSDRLRRQPV